MNNGRLNCCSGVFEKKNNFQYFFHGYKKKVLFCRESRESWNEENIRIFNFKMSKKILTNKMNIDTFFPPQNSLRLRFHINDLHRKFIDLWCTIWQKKCELCLFVFSFAWNGKRWKDEWKLGPWHGCTDKHCSFRSLTCLYIYLLSRFFFHNFFFFSHKDSRWSWSLRALFSWCAKIFESKMLEDRKSFDVFFNSYIKGRMEEIEGWWWW